MTRYILIPQRQGKTQRITIPMALLRKKDWLRTVYYMMTDEGKEEVTLKQHLSDDTKESAELDARSSSRHKLTGESSDD